VGLLDKFKKKDDSKKADFSNVQSGSSSTAPSPAPADQLPQEPLPGASGGSQQQTHVVASGDTLSKIAKRYYGDANQWRRIYEANQDIIKNPDLIHPGQQLKIPGV
jgi:nucleoid-associated protein YgaU